MYLPQFHQIPENDEFWGKGFTDWVTVKNAKPLFKRHLQPKVPLDNRYYDLSDEKNLIWQSKLASKYGVYGFGFYHYWFNNQKNLLTKPAEIIRDSTNVNINYFLAWDNANWVRSWSNVSGNAWAPIIEKNINKEKAPQILIPYILGEKPDWENHYNEVRLHFKKAKYIKVNNKPVFMIFNYNDKINEMCKFWEELAIKDGFNGVYFIIKRKKGIEIPSYYPQFKYEPLYSGWMNPSIKERIGDRFRKFFNFPSKVKKYNYDVIWSRIIANAENDVEPNLYHGAFVSYDDTPRRGNRGRVVCNSSPTKFGLYLKRLKQISERQGREFIFLTAWNEWGEGAYLEPDKNEEYNYLESIKNLKK